MEIRIENSLTGGNRVVFVKMSKEEALCTIRSLSVQMLYNDPNIERLEVDCKE